MRKLFYNSENYTSDTSTCTGTGSLSSFFNFGLPVATKQGDGKVAAPNSFGKLAGAFTALAMLVLPALGFAQTITGVVFNPADPCITPTPAGGWAIQNVTMNLPQGDPALNGLEYRYALDVAVPAVGSPAGAVNAPFGAAGAINNIPAGPHCLVAVTVTTSANVTYNGTLYPTLGTVVATNQVCLYFGTTPITAPALPTENLTCPAAGATTVTLASLPLAPPAPTCFVYEYSVDGGAFSVPPINVGPGCHTLSRRLACTGNFFGCAAGFNAASPTVNFVIFNNLSDVADASITVTTSCSAYPGPAAGSVVSVTGLPAAVTMFEYQLDGVGGWLSLPIGSIAPGCHTLTIRERADCPGATADGVSAAPCLKTVSFMVFPSFTPVFTVNQNGTCVSPANLSLTGLPALPAGFEYAYSLDGGAFTTTVPTGVTTGCHNLVVKVQTSVACGRTPVGTDGDDANAFTNPSCLSQSAVTNFAIHPDLSGLTPTVNLTNNGCGAAVGVSGFSPALAALPAGMIYVYSLDGGAFSSTLPAGPLSVGCHSITVSTICAAAPIAGVATNDARLSNNTCRVTRYFVVFPTLTAEAVLSVTVGCANPNATISTVTVSGILPAGFEYVYQLNGAGPWNAIPPALGPLTAGCHTIRAKARWIGGGGSNCATGQDANDLCATPVFNFVVYPDLSGIDPTSVTIATSCDNPDGAITDGQVTSITGLPSLPANLSYQYSFDGGAFSAASASAANLASGCHYVTIRVVNTCPAPANGTVQDAACRLRITFVIFPDASDLDINAVVLNQACNPANVTGVDWDPAAGVQPPTAVAGFEVRYSLNGGTYSTTLPTALAASCHTLSAKYFYTGAACAQAADAAGPAGVFNNITEAPNACVETEQFIVWPDISASRPVVTLGTTCGTTNFLVNGVGLTPPVGGISATHFEAQYIYTINGGAPVGPVNVPTLLAVDFGVGCHTIQMVITSRGCGAVAAGTAGPACATSLVTRFITFPAPPTLTVPPVCENDDIVAVPGSLPPAGYGWRYRLVNTVTNTASGWQILPTWLNQDPGCYRVEVVPVRTTDCGAGPGDFLNTPPVIFPSNYQNPLDMQGAAVIDAVPANFPAACVNSVNTFVLPSPTMAITPNNITVCFDETGRIDLQPHTAGIPACLLPPAAPSTLAIAYAVTSSDPSVVAPTAGTLPGAACTAAGLATLLLETGLPFPQAVPLDELAWTGVNGSSVPKVVTIGITPRLHFDPDGAGPLAPVCCDGMEVKFSITVLPRLQTPPFQVSPSNGAMVCSQNEGWTFSSSTQGVTPPSPIYQIPPFTPAGPIAGCFYELYYGATALNLPYPANNALIQSVQAVAGQTLTFQKVYIPGTYEIWQRCDDGCAAKVETFVVSIDQAPTLIDQRLMSCADAPGGNSGTFAWPTTFPTFTVGAGAAQPNDIALAAAGTTVHIKGYYTTATGAQNATPGDLISAHPVAANFSYTSVDASIYVRIGQDGNNDGDTDDVPDGNPNTADDCYYVVEIELQIKNRPVVTITAVPTPICVDDVVELTANVSSGSGSAYVYTWSANATPTGPNAPTAIGNSAVSGIQTYRVTVTDPNTGVGGAGMVFACETEAEIDVNYLDPFITNCPANIVKANAPGECRQYVNFAVPILNLPCGTDFLPASPYEVRYYTTGATLIGSQAAPVFHSQVSGVWYNVGVTNVFGVIYLNGIEYTGTAAPHCQFTVTVQDQEEPIALCRDFTIELNAAGNASIDVDQAELNSVNAGLYDNCPLNINFALPVECGDAAFIAAPNPKVCLSKATFTCANIGQNIVAMNLWDAAGNFATCNATITVVDRIRPEITCPPAITISGCNSTTPNIIGLVTAAMVSDNCTSDADLLASLQQNPLPGDALSSVGNPNGTSSIVLTVTDGSGNTRTCATPVTITTQYTLALDVPEICLSVPANSSLIDFRNYLTITNNNTGAVVPVPNGGAFASAFSIASSNVAGGTAGSITPAGVYTPGTGTGFVTIRYTLTETQNGVACAVYAEDVFELRQPLTMDASACACNAGEREVNLTNIGAGLAPYTLTVDGAVLTAPYNGTAATATIRLNAGQTSWSVTLRDSRGCELTLSGSCATFTEPPVFQNLQNAVCASDPDFTITMAHPSAAGTNANTPANGTFLVTGPAGVTAAQINAIFGAGAAAGTLAGSSITVNPTPVLTAPAQAGVYTITFTYGQASDVSDNCRTHTISAQITIYPSFNACFPLPAPVLNGAICRTAAPITLAADPLFNGSPLFGQTVAQTSVWSMTDGQGNLYTTNGGPLGPFTAVTANGNTTFNPFFLQPGIYTINHSLGFDACQTECVATIEIKATVNATLVNRTVCASPSSQTNLVNMYTPGTTAGGTFTVVAAIAAGPNGVINTPMGVWTPVGDDQNALATGNVSMGGGSILNYNENGPLDYRILVRYAVGDPACEVTADDGDNGPVPPNAGDCFQVKEAVLTIVNGHGAFLDLPETVYCSNAANLPLAPSSSIEDVTIVGLPLDVTPNNLLSLGAPNTLANGFPPAPGVGQVRYDVVAVNGSTALNAFIIDGDGDNGPVPYANPAAVAADIATGMDFDIRSIISNAGCAGDVLSLTCPSINFANIPKEVILTIRITYNDGGCISIAEDNIRVKPYGNAKIKNAGPICLSTPVINLPNQVFIPIGQVGGPTMICGKFKINCLGMPTVDPGYTDNPNAGVQGWFDPADANYPNYNLAALLASLPAGYTPEKLYVSYMVGHADCNVDTKDAVIDLCPQPVAFPNLTVNVGCTEGSPISLNALASLPNGAPGVWYGPFANAAAANAAAALFVANGTFPAAGFLVANPNSIDPLTLASGQAFIYLVDVPAGCTCNRVAGVLTIGTLTNGAAPETCHFFGNGVTYHGAATYNLQPKYCSDDVALTKQLLRRVCPELVSVGVRNDAACNVENITNMPLPNVFTETTLSVNVPTVVYPNANINDDWYIQMIYMNNNANMAVPGVDDGDGSCIPGTTSGLVNDPDDLLGGFHTGFIFGGSGLPLNKRYVVENGQCPTTGASALGGFPVEMYMHQQLGANSPYNPTAPVKLPTVASLCGSGSNAGPSNDYFILQLDACDIYAMYDDGNAANGDGKRDFIRQFFGCGTTPSFTWNVGAATQGNFTDFAMVLNGMQIYNYKEDVTRYNNGLACASTNTLPDGPADLGFTIDASCDGVAQTGAAANLPAWLNVANVFTVETVAGSDPGKNDCYDVFVHLNELIQPNCNDVCYNFEITHQIQKCTGGCPPPVGGDGRYSYARCVSVDKKPNLVAAEPVTSHYKMGCVDQKPSERITDIVSAFGFTTDICSPTCGATPGLPNCPASCSSGCFAAGNFKIPAPFIDYVINDGVNIIVLPTVINALAGSTALAAYKATDPNYPTMNDKKRFYIPFTYTVMSSCKTCPPETLTRYLYVTRAPQMVLNIPASPGICPEDVTTIPTGMDCVWPDCVYRITLKNQQDHVLLDNIVPRDLKPQMICKASNLGVDPNQKAAPGVVVNNGNIMIDWDQANINEPLFGDFVLTVTVWCGTKEYFCSSTASQPLFFLGESDATLAGPLVVCDGDPIELEDLWVPGVTTPGGLFEVFPSNGVPGVSGTAVNVTGIAPGLYDIRYTIGSTSACAEFFILENGLKVVGPVVATITNSTNPNCEGGTTGTATAAGSGGDAPYTYLWSNDQTGPNATGLFAGTWCVTVTDANGCTGVDCVVLADPTGVQAMIMSHVDVKCWGQCTGEATAQGVGGTPPYTYDWSNNGAQNPDTDGATMTGLCAGQHKVTITDSKGCQAVAVVEIDQPTRLFAEAIDIQATFCNGSSNTGEGTVNATGGTTPYTYDWPNVPGTNDPNTVGGLAAGTYTVTVTDVNLCSTTVNVVIPNGPPLTISELPDLGFICANDPFRPGNNPFAGNDGEWIGPICLYSTPWSANTVYSWTGGAAAGLPDGTATGTTPCIPAWQVADAPGNYTITVTATLANGCVDTEIFTFAVLQGPANPPLNDTYHLYECEMEFATLRANFNLEKALPNILAGFGNEAPFFKVTFHRTLQDAELDEDRIQSLFLAQNTPTTNTSVWIRVQNVFTGCFSTAEVILHVHPRPLACSANVAVCPVVPGNDYGYFNLYGNTNLYNQVTTCNPGTAPGYQATVTFHLSLSEAELDQNPIPNGPFFSNARTIWVRVENGIGCYEVDIVNLEVLQSPAVDLDTKDESCAGANDGTILATVLAGKAPFNFNWSAGVTIDPTKSTPTTSGVKDLAPGVYTVTVTDANGCTVSASVTIAPGAPLTITALPDFTVCPEAAVGSIELSATPKVLDVTYTWMGGAPAGIANQLAGIGGADPEIPAFIASDNEGSWTVTVTGRYRGCVDTEDFTITINDDIKPVFIQCPGNMVVNADVDKCSAVVKWAEPLAKDECEPDVIITQTAGAASGSVFNVPGSPYTISYTADDTNGNTAVCSFTVTVRDMQLPTVSCPGGTQSFGTNNGLCSWTAPGAASLNATAADNCSIASLTHNFAGAPSNTTIAGGVFPLGATMVTWTAVDASGNSRTCTYRLVVVDDDIPTVTACPSNIIRSNDPGVCGATVTYTVTFADNCGGTATQINGLPSGSVFPVGLTVVEWSYNDAASNGPVNCSFTVTVNDTENPTIVCPANVVVNVGGNPVLTGGPATLVSSGPCGITLSYAAPVGADNCPGVVTNNVSGLGAGPNFYEYGGFYTETWNVFDNAGNKASCSFSIEVKDPINPTITCPANTTVTTDAGECDAAVSYAFPYEGDNCPNFKLTKLVGPNSGEEFNVGTTLVKFEVKDPAGNTATCEFTVTVEDRERPFITFCPPPTTATTSSNGNGDCSGAVPNMASGLGATDNCGVTAVSQVPLPGQSFGSAHGDVQIVTFFVTDAAGNSRSCQSTVRLVDDEKPTIVCTGLTTSYNTTPGICGHLVTAADNANPSFGDNCAGAKRRHNFPTAPSHWTLEGAILPVGTTTVVWTITDINNNTTACAVTYTVTDNVAPIFVNCPANITVGNDVDKCGANVFWLAPIAIDDCQPVTVVQTAGPAAGSLFPVGATLISYKATDPSGNMATCSWTITVTDMQLPDIQCPSGIQYLATNVACTHVLSGTVLNATASDNCAVTSLTHNYTNLVGGATTLNGATFPLGATVVRWTAADAAGNTRSCTFTVVVQDLTDPTVQTCPNNISTITDPNLCSAVVNYTVFFQDNCDGGNRVGTRIEGLASGSAFPLGTTTVIHRYVDAASNDFAECQFTVTVRDFQSPVISCPTNIIVNANGTISGGTGGSPLASPVITAAGPCGVNLRYIAPVGTDNCPNPQTDNIGGLGDGAATGAGNYYAYNGVYTEVWRVTDASGNSATCSFTITVLDGVTPSITCPSNTTVNNDLGECDAAVDYAFPYFADNCFNYTLTQLAGPNSGQEFPVGTTSVSFRVTDNAGNSTSCSFTVTVLDKEKPVITTCPPARNINTSSNGTGDCSGLVPNLIPEVVATDNCQVASITQSPLAGTSFGSAHNDVIWVVITVTDIYGNSTTCQVQLTLKDDERPTINCAVIPTALDNTPGYCHYFVPGFNLNPTYADNCGPLVLTNSLTGNNTLGGTPLAVGSTLVTWTVTDANGNTSACSVTYVVSDSEPPVAKCQGPQIDVVLDGDGLAQLTVSNVNNGSYDNCQLVSSNIKREDSASAFGQSVTFDCSDAFFFPTFNLEGVVLEVRDQAGNITRCTTSVTVLDLESPVITCPNGIETVTDPNLCTAIVNGIGLQYSHDNCPTTTTYAITGATTKTGNNDASGTIFNKGFSTVTYTVVDASGNAANCSFDVEVEDAELPVIDCSNITNIVRSNATNQCGYTVSGTEFDPATYSDNCPAATISNDYNHSSSLAGADFPVGKTTVIWTVTDASGNTITCISKVTINDTQVPVIACPTATATTLNNTTGQCAAVVLSDVLDAGFSDNCPGAELRHNYVVAPNHWTLSGATFPVGSTTVVFTVTDKAGNSATCSIVVKVNDTEKPTFVNCPTSMVMVGNDVDKCSAKVNWPQPVAEDNCDILAVTQTGGPGSGTEIAVGAPFTVTYRATDVNGNTQICSFQVQVVDTQKPQFDADIVMPGDVTVQCDAVPAPFVLTNNDVFDNCTPSAQLVITFTQTSTQGTNPAACSFYDYVITRTWRVTDAAGNTLSHVQVVTVKDTTKPVAKCKNATVTLDKFGVATVTGATINDGSTDNCATNFLTFTVTPSSFDCSKLGANTVILTVSDPCGNTATCQATVTVLEGPGKCQPEYDLANSVKCECKNNATNDVNGQFNEVIQIKALAGQTWTINTSNGLFASNSPAPPAAPIALTAGAAMTMGSADGIDNDKDGQTDEADEMIYYTLRAVHVEAIGYTVTLKNVQGQSLTISNKCYYPSPVFTNLNDPFCLTTPAFTIGVADNFGGQGTVKNVTINGSPATVFNASQLGVGQHKVAATFDAGTATPFITVNGVVVSGSEEAALKDPGCEQMIMQFVQVVGTPSTVVCNDNLNVSLEADCSFTITPDDVMEGTYFCYDDYKVELDKLAPFGNGPWVPAVVGTADIGKTYQYRVTHVIGGNICWGNVTIEDKLAPVITCPADRQILCTQSEDNLSLTGQPTWTDCSNVTISRQDDYIQYTCAQNANVFTRVLRTWVATDAWGNSATCLQVIDVLRGKISQLTWPTDKEYPCNALPSSLEPSVTGWPTIGGVNLTTNGSGSCGLSVSYTDEDAAVCPGSHKIIRTWKITDWCTTSGQPESITYVQYIKVTDVAPTVDFSNFNYDADHGWYNVSAKGTVNGQCVATGALPLAIIDGVCNNVVQVKITTPVGVMQNGGQIPSPGLGLGQHPIKYFVEDECGNITNITIIVNVLDDIPPAVACDQETKVAIAGSGVSVVFAETFDDKTWDNCCLDPKFEVARMNGDCNGQPDDFGPSVTFCCSDIGDTITVVFRAWDCSKNSNDCMVRVLVEDKIRPTCEPPAPVTVSCENFDPSLWAYGFATGEDNCCMDTVTTTTSYTQFDTLCSRGTITRTFRAFDCAGNSQQCTQRIFVNYEQDYFVRFPDDRLVTVCDGTGNYGEPTFLNKDCELLGVSFTDEVFTVVPDACYKIERTWHIINWCRYNANIPLTAVPNPNPNATVNSPANNPGPVISSSSNANVVAAPWTATRVALTPGAAQTDFSVFYLGGTYTFNGVTITVPSIENSNGFSYKQIIKVLDTQDPTIDNCPASPVTFCDLTPNNGQLWNESYWYDNTTMSHDLCEGPTDLTITATDACSGAAVNIKYLLFLDTDNNGSMETVISSTNLPGFNNVNFNNAQNPNFTGGLPQAFDERPVPSNQKYGFALQTTVSGNKKTAAVRWNTFQSQTTYVVPELPYGTHKIKWIVEDGCGNESVCEYTFIVKDCKAPTVVCKNGLSVNIMPTGMITLWASDFLEYTEDNCTPANKLQIGIRKAGTGTGFPLDAQGNPITSVTWTCAETGQQEVELWSIDLAGNADFCQTYIIVQDNGNFCNPDFATVAGALKTEELKGLEEAEVQLTSANTAQTQTVMTNDAGAYNFTNVPKAQDYTITPTHDVNPLNGVSTYDLVLISKHILGLEPLNSPYKMIAADANKSGSITTFDIVEIRKLILGIYTELPNNTSWRFVDKSFQFSDPLNPFKTLFPETKSLLALSAPKMEQDFVAVKVGDVNASATANSLMSSEDRTAGTLLFDVTDRTVKAGETFEVTFKAAEQVKGYQFTLNFNGLAVEEVVPGTDMSNLNFGVFADALTTSFDGKSAGEFTVMFRATKSGKLSQMLGVSSRITRAEAYALNGERNAVALRFNGNVIAGVGFELYQNEPNPFVNKTFIGFHLPEAATATLTVRDETGRTLFTQKGDFAKGYNSVALERELLPSVGVLFYTLETATDSATKKMVQTK